MDVLINNAAVQRPWKIQIENHADRQCHSRRLVASRHHLPTKLRLLGGR